MNVTHRLVLGAALFASPLFAQTSGFAVTGSVADAASQPIRGATVSIVELNRAGVTSATGEFRLSEIPAGQYTLSIRRLGYAPAARPIVVSGPLALGIIQLQQQALRTEPVNVSAQRAPAASVGTALATSVMTGEEVHHEGGVSLAHSLASLPGVRNVSTGQEVGKPMIRGLFGPRVLVLADGSRLEDYSWSDEDGPSIDARIAQRIEVIRGPASVLYGSEALSGVVNVIPADLAYSADGAKQQRRAMEVYAASNNLELGGALLAEGAQSKYAWRLMGTGRFSQNYQTPAGALQNSSFWAFNGEGALGIRNAAGNTTVRVAHYGGEFHLLEASGPEADDTEGGPVRQTLDDRLQITNDHVFGAWRLETKGQWQRHGLTEVSDDCVPAPGQTTCTKVKDKVAFDLALNTGTADVLLHQPVLNHLTGVLGVSGMYQNSASTGPIFLVPSATVNAAGTFAFEQATAGMWSLVAGARADTRNLSADAQPEISRSADSRSWTATTADVGVVFRPMEALAFTANYGGGWRAPTLFDLYANGPNLAEARFEVGDPSLKTEQSHDLDGGMRWMSDRVHAEVTVFRNTVKNFTFTTPTSSTQSGLQVFRHIQADAELTGAEAMVDARLTDAFVVRARHDFVRGTETASDTPLPLMPPPRTTLGATYLVGRVGALSQVSVGSDVEIDQKQTRLNPEDFATAGYALLNVDISAQHVVHTRPVRFDLMVRNALNTSYRDYLSRFKTFAFAPGVNVILKASFGAW
jgi:iron complex outermembrane recepter protein